MMIKIKNWNIEEMTGYKPKTTFYTDLGIAEVFGINAVKETAGRVFAEWKNNVEYFTEFVMALNWKSWEHSEGDQDLCETYTELFHMYNNWCLKNYKGKDAEYYFQTTD